MPAEAIPLTSEAFDDSAVPLIIAIFVLVAIALTPVFAPPTARLYNGA